MNELVLSSIVIVPVAMTAPIEHACFQPEIARKDCSAPGGSCCGFSALIAAFDCVSDAGLVTGCCARRKGTQMKKNAVQTKQGIRDGNFGRMAPPQVRVLGPDYLVSCGRILPNERLSMTNLEEKNIALIFIPRMGHLVSSLVITLW
jgi:hypothetical protein